MSIKTQNPSDECPTCTNTNMPAVIMIYVFTAPTSAGSPPYFEDKLSDGSGDCRSKHTWTGGAADPRELRTCDENLLIVSEPGGKYVSFC